MQMSSDEMAASSGEACYGRDLDPLDGVSRLLLSSPLYLCHYENEFQKQNDHKILKLPSSKYTLSEMLP